MDIERLRTIVEGALLAAGQPLSLNQLNGLFPPDEQPGHGLLRQALAALDAELEGRAVELKEVASGYRLQIRAGLMPVIARLWAEKPPRYSRALLETLAIIAYRQPITRGEIEEIRGVSLSPNILRTLQEREWIKVLGHRDVPGRPELLGTTRAFLDYFNLKSLDELPTLAEIKDLDNLEPELALVDPDRPVEGEATGEEAAPESSGAEEHADPKAPRSEAEQNLPQEDPRDIPGQGPGADRKEDRPQNRPEYRQENRQEGRQDPGGDAADGQDRSAKASSGTGS